MSISTSITAFAPAASDFTGDEGLIVVRTAPAAGLPRVALATAASAQAFGIIEYVGFGALGQELRICDFGKTFVVLGAGWGAPAATEAAFMSDANGAAIPATAGSRVVGRLTFNELTSLAAGNRVECLVYPFELET
ncbi:MAG: hypothetical protein EHM24_27370 [Acidobacteria bacterium]|nr:MAG: hypothetical protein EHM24_27370 [Acidobacteriota bacterium]